MPLPKPTLDNRSFDQLVAEGRGQIPRLAPQWTDHNASDAGITLLELVAWLTEQNIYRFDRPSDESLRAFARLAGIHPRPPGVAHTVVAIDDPGGAGATLPARMQLASDSVALFETTDALHVCAAKLLTPAVGLAFGARPRVGNAVYLGFDRALHAPGKTLVLHVWTDTWERDAATRDALVAEFDAMLERLKRECPCDAGKAAAVSMDWRHHYRVNTAWEYHAGGGVWVPLSDVVDETRSLTLTGFVRFTAPIEHQSGGPGPHFFIRCRIRGGRFECPPRLRHIAFNAVAAEHALSQPEKWLGDARGHAHAVFAFEKDQPVAVVAGQTKLRLNDGKADDKPDWHEVLEWDRSGSHDRDFRVTPERGELQSGDGLRAMVLPAGYSLYASYQQGGGEAGNIAAETLKQVPPNAANTALAPTIAGFARPLVVSQPFDATGGAPRETLRSVKARAYENATRVDKAVTVADFERLALATPGVPVAHVHAVPGLHPAMRCYPAPGVVTLIVVPSCPLPAPRPSQALLDAVVRFLEPRRLVTSEIHAVAPVYRRITVHATLQIGCDGVADEVRKLAVARIGAFFDPLTGGPDLRGWLIGRTVYRSEVMALLANLDGVLRVTDFGLQGRGDAGPRCDNITLCPYELVVPGRHRLQLTTYLSRNLKRSDAHECKPL